MKIRKVSRTAGARRVLAVVLVLSLLVALSSCGGTKEASSSSEKSRPYIAVISKGFQHEFWQNVNIGSKAAAADLGLDITFEGPPSEADVAAQVKMAQAALAKKPQALCLAATDASALSPVLLEAQKAGIPVIGFDSGVPDAPEGIIVSTASTDNYAAGQLAAKNMYEEASLTERIRAASPQAPVVIGVLSQDAVSASVLDRTKGFIDEFKSLAEAVHPGGVTVTGHELFDVPATSGSAAVRIEVVVPATPNYSDTQRSAELLLADAQNLVGVFCSNEGTITGLLAATNDGVDLDRATGRYRDLIVVGFDAGVSQKNAVKKQYIYGSVTQDPYQIGYQAVVLAYKAIQGEQIPEVVDTGCKFYTNENIDDPEIANLLYD